MMNFENNSEIEQSPNNEKIIEDAKKYGIEPEQIAYTEEDINQNTVVYKGEINQENAGIVIDKLKDGFIIDKDISIVDSDGIKELPNAIYSKEVNLVNCKNFETIKTAANFIKMDRNDPLDYHLSISNCENFKNISPGVFLEHKVAIGNCASFEDLGENNEFLDNVRVSNCENFKKISQEVKFNGITSISNCENFEEIENGVEFNGGLSLVNNPKITSLENKIKLNGYIIIEDCPNLINISENVEFKEGTTLELDNFEELNEETKERLSKLAADKKIQIIRH